MPKYTKAVRIPGKSASELYEKVSSEIDRFLSKTPIGNYELDRDPDHKKLTASSKMFSAVLICTDENLELDVSLSLLATPFRGQLDQAIDRWLSKTFNV